MPSTEKLPSGRFRAIYRDANGDKQHVKGTFERKTDAKEAAVDAESKAKRQAAAARGELSARTTWGDWWQVVAERRTFEHSDTATNEAKVVRLYLAPKWGDVQLNRITHHEVQGWVDTLDRSGKAPTYTHYIAALFARTIRIAVKEGVLTADPTAGLTLPKRRRKAKDFFTDDQVRRITEHMPQRIADAITFALLTGLRPNELFGLHAADVADAERGWLTVQHVRVNGRKIIRPWPKDSDTRDVPLSTRATEILRRRLDGRDLTERCPLPHYGDEPCTSPLVFQARRGGPLYRDLLNLEIYQATDAASLPAKSAYALRRGFATWLAGNNASPFDIAAWMGHADVRQTSEYVQVAPEARGRFLKAIGEPESLRAVGGETKSGPDGAVGQGEAEQGERGSA
jgi:integrase